MLPLHVISGLSICLVITKVVTKRDSEALSLSRQKLSVTCGAAEHQMQRRWEHDKIVKELGDIIIWEHILNID